MKQADSEYHSTIHTKWLEMNPQRLFIHQRIALFPRLMRTIPSIQTARILDIGAGTGYAGIYLARQFPDVTVVALEESRVAAEQLIPRMAAAHGVHDRVTARHGSFDSFQSTELFDVVLSFGALHHSQVLPASFHAMRAVLKPEGWLVAHEPVMPDTTTNAQFVAKYESIEFKAGVRIQNLARDDHFFRRCEYLCAAAHSGLDISSEQRVDNRQLWSRLHLRRRNLSGLAQSLVHRLSPEPNKLSPGLHNRLFIWRPSNTQWIPHSWTPSPLIP